MAKRTQLHLIPFEGAWAIRLDGQLVCKGITTKREALAIAVEYARNVPPSSLKVHGRNGRILEERTYGGGDPFPPAG